MSEWPRSASIWPADGRASSGDIDNHHQTATATCLRVVVRRVVADVTVDQPLSGTSRFPDDIETLARSDIDRVGGVPGRWLQRLPVDRHDLKRTTVDVHRMNEAVARSDKADL